MGIRDPVWGRGNPNAYGQLSWSVVLMVEIRFGLSCLQWKIGLVFFCLRLSTFARVCLRFRLCVCLRLSAFACVCLRLLAFAYAPLCCAPLCVTLNWVGRFLLTVPLV